jgi:DNA polymerase alpha subunit A
MDLSNDQLGHEVIYGDTDSIMVYTATDDLEEVKKIGSEIKREVNKKYNKLEIEIDGIMQSMLLLNKKKYAALMIEEKGGKTITVKETKGLDLVRRDWCELSQDVGNFVLDRILSGENREEVVQSIHDHLTEMAKSVRENKLPLRKYIVTKCLTKPPESYPDKGGLPHVHVALALKARGDTVPVGTHVQYCICKNEDSNVPYAKRAHHPDQIERADGMLQVDAEWYLAQQIHPPIARLLNPIEGTDSGRIAECLGLDASKFRHEVAKEDEEDAIPNVVLDDQDRFRDCAVFEVACPACGVVGQPGAQEWSNRLKCASCKEKLPLHTVQNALTLAVRAAITKFNDGWMVCEESTCPQRIRQVSLAFTNAGKHTEVGRQCLRVGCHGAMEKEYSDKALYTQMVYLQSIFDYARFDRLAERKVRGTSKEDKVERVEDKVILIKKELQHLSSHVQGYLQQSGFNMISLADVFSGIIKR